MREVAIPPQPGLGCQGAVGLVSPRLVQPVQPALDLGIALITVPEKLLQLLPERSRRGLRNVLSLKPVEDASGHNISVAKICSMSIGHLRTEFNPAPIRPHPAPPHSPSLSPSAVTRRAMSLSSFHHPTDAR